MRSHHRSRRAARSAVPAARPRPLPGLLAGALLLAGTFPAGGCRGRNLIGSRGGDGGLPQSDGAGADVTPPRDGADAAAPDDGATPAPDGSGPLGDAASDPSPEVVDPQISRAWTWQPCGVVAPAAPDTGAAFDAQGNIAVLGPGGVRLYDPSGRPFWSWTGAADFVVATPAGSLFAGEVTSSAIVMTPIGVAGAPRTFTFPAGSACGRLVSFSQLGDLLLAYDDRTACIWQVSDQRLVGNIEKTDTTFLQAGLRGDKVVTIEPGAQATTDLVTRDYSGRETARVKIALAGTPYLSPSADRLVMSGTLWNLDDGALVPLTPAPSASSIPTFSAAGDLVLLGDDVFSTKTGVRKTTADPGNPHSPISHGDVALSSDGSRFVVNARGRATLWDLASPGIAAVLGPPVRTEPPPYHNPIDHLALSADGSVLAVNISNSAAFGLEVAASFAASKVIWIAFTEINSFVDLSGDDQLVAIGGDGRAIFSAVDGRSVWPSPPPPPGISNTVCVPERLRFSPKRTWVAGSNYDRVVDVFAVGDGTSATQWKPVVQLDAGCEAVAFSRDERLMATSGAALYQTAPTADGWRKVWSAVVPTPSVDVPFAWWANDVSFSPDETQLLVSQCIFHGACAAPTLLSAQTGALLRSLPELQAPHPSFSPDGSWIVAGGTLLHLASGDVRPLDPTVQTTVALFTPEGDIIAGSADDVLTRYCRSP